MSKVTICDLRGGTGGRESFASNAELSKKLHDLEAKYDKQFKVVFDAIRQLMMPGPESKRRIGFAPWDDST